MKIRMRDRILLGLAVGGEILDNVEGAGSRAYHSAKLYIWTPPGYSRRKYRDLVGRLIREGLMQRVLIDGKVNFRLTGAGRRLIISSYPSLKKASQEWDGFWRVVIFDIPEKDRKQRDLLRRELIKLGFGRLHNSTYISAFEYDKEFLDWLEVRKLKERVFLLESKQKHLGDPKKLAEKVWDLDELALGYEKVTERLTTRFGIKDQIKREEFFKKVYQDYLSLVIKDPFLPKILLPENWPAKNASKYILRAGVVRE